MLLAKFPVCKQFTAVQLGPVEHQLQGTTRQPALQQCKRLDVDHCLELAVFSIKCGGACSLKNMRMTMPKKRLMIGIVDTHPPSASR